MSKPKHTPGSWHYALAPSGEEFRIGGGVAGHVATVEILEDGKAVAEADARLIAAAPEMIELLERIKAISVFDELPLNLQRLVTAVIQKVRNGS